MNTPFSTRKTLAAAAACAVLSACTALTTTPPTSVHQPMSVRPAEVAPAPATNGAIYQTGYGYRPLFEDRRARNVGDTLTINIVENTAADKKSNTSTKRASDNNFAVASLAGLPGKSFLDSRLAAGSDFQFNGEGASTSANAVTGTLTVTVTNVLPNGNLVVSGEKQIGINQGSEFIRVSGVVNPIHVTFANSVNSVQLADARVEYRANGQIENAQQMGWLSRFFLNVLPF